MTLFTRTTIAAAIIALGLAAASPGDEAADLRHEAICRQKLRLLVLVSGPLKVTATASNDPASFPGGTLVETCRSAIRAACAPRRQLSARHDHRRAEGPRGADPADRTVHGRGDADLDAALSGRRLRRQAGRAESHRSVKKTIGGLPMVAVRRALRHRDHSALEDPLCCRAGWRRCGVHGGACSDGRCGECKGECCGASKSAASGGGRVQEAMAHSMCCLCVLVQERRRMVAYGPRKWEERF